MRRVFHLMCICVAACGADGAGAPAVSDAGEDVDAGAPPEVGPRMDAAGRDAEVLDAPDVVADATVADAADGDGGVADASSARVAFTRVEGGVARIFSVRTDGRELMRLTDGPGADHSSAWSPDGQRLAFISTRGGPRALYILDVRTGSVAPIVTTLFQVASPAWHPTLDLLAIEGRSSAATRPDVYTVTSAGVLERLTEDPLDDVGPSFTPDGASVLFASNRSGRHELYRMDLVARRPTRLTTNSGLVGRATLHRDGCELVFSRVAAMGVSELVALDVCAANASVTPLGQSGDEPSFSQTADALVFTTLRFGGPAIMLWEDRAGAPVRLTTGTGLDIEGALGPP